MIPYKPDRAQSLLHKLTLFGRTLQEVQDTRESYQLPYGHHRNLISIGAQVRFTNFVFTTVLSSCVVFWEGRWSNMQLGNSLIVLVCLTTRYNSACEEGCLRNTGETMLCARRRDRSKHEARLTIYQMRMTTCRWGVTKEGNTLNEPRT